MISSNIISKISIEEGIGWGIVEKDYFLTLLLDGISNQDKLLNNLVFKGGTALRKVYFKNYRYSEDLDFTLRKPMKEGEINEYAEAIFEFLKKEHNADFRLKNFYIRKWFTDLKIQFNGLRGGKNTITMDLGTDEIIVDKIERKHIFNPYYDTSFSIPIYSLEEILAEKLRSLLQRTRIRDYYDVWYLLTRSNERIDPKKVGYIFNKKVNYKKLEFSEKTQLLEPTKMEQARSYYKLKIGDQLKDPPNFDRLIKELSEEIDALNL